MKKLLCGIDDFLSSTVRPVALRGLDGLSLKEGDVLELLSGLHGRKFMERVGGRSVVVCFDNRN